MTLISKLRRSFVFIITNLIVAIRPLFGSAGCCKFTPSCTHYAEQTLQSHPLHKACWLILRRVFCCR